MNHRIALGIEYDGSQFQGWQRQATGPSVQAELESALSKVANIPIATICAGRTDTGVHASGQVVHFDSSVIRSEHAWVFGTNTELSLAVRVRWARAVPNHFNARRSAISRRYRYVIYNHPIRPSILRQFLSWEYRKLDISRMKEASQYWLGEHDFSSFRGSQCQSRSPIRHIHSIQVLRLGDQVIIELVANAFLHHMVRNMVGVLIRIGSGRAEVSWAKGVLEARDRRAAAITAPPMGLYLVEVQYPEEFALP